MRYSTYVGRTLATAHNPDTMWGKVKGRVKLMQRVKIAYSFLQSGSNLFHLII